MPPWTNWQSRFSQKEEFSRFDPERGYQDKCPCGEIGRHAMLRSLCEFSSVLVRVQSRAPINSELREWSNRPPWKGVRCIAALGFESLTHCQSLNPFVVQGKADP